MEGTKNFLLTLCLVGFCMSTTNAQTTRDVETNPSYLVYPAAKQKQKSKFGSFKIFSKKKKTARKSLYETEKKFKERMKSVAKQKKKEARLARKPQYAKQEYFGHKRKPKKRPVGKKKYCKVCEFAH